MKKKKDRKRMCDDFADLRVVDLRAECKQRGLLVGGLKKELIKRLEDFEKRSGKPNDKKRPLEEMEDQEEEGGDGESEEKYCGLEKSEYEYWRNHFCRDYREYGYDSPDEMMASEQFWMGE
jgi:hypothetical protein